MAYFETRTTSLLKSSGSGTAADPYVIYVSLDDDTIGRLNPAAVLFHETYSTATSHTAIAAPAAGYRLLLTSLTVIALEDGENTITVKDGSDAFGTIPAALRFDGFNWSNVRLSEATAFVVANTGAYDFVVFGSYIIEEV